MFLSSPSLKLIMITTRLGKHHPLIVYHSILLPSIKFCPFIIHKPFSELIGREIAFSVCDEFFSWFDFPGFEFCFKKWVTTNSGVIASACGVKIWFNIWQFTSVCFKGTYNRTFILATGNNSVAINRICSFLLYKKALDKTKAWN